MASAINSPQFYYPVSLKPIWTKYSQKKMSDSALNNAVKTGPFL